MPPLTRIPPKVRYILQGTQHFFRYRHHRLFGWSLVLILVYQDKATLCGLPSLTNPCSAPQGVAGPTQTWYFLAISLQAQRQTQPLIDFVHERLISLAQYTQHEHLMQ